MASKYNVLAIKVTLALMLSAIVMLTLINVYRDWLGTQGILVNFFVFYILISAVLYLPIYLILGNVRKSLLLSASVALAHAAFDTWLPPYALDINGTILQSTALGYTGSIDYLFGVIGQAVGVHGFLLYLFTYVLMPVVLLVIALWMLGSSKFIKEITNF